MDDGRGARDFAEPARPTPDRWVRVWASRALLLRVARRHGADSQDAEDAVQEAMLRAAEHPEIPEERLQAWLVAVTIRLCMDGHRRRAREARRWQRISAYAAAQQPGQHLEDAACERSEAAWVASLVAEILPPRQVQALRLTAAGCDVHQVASQLGVRYRAAESLLARARRTVRLAATAGLGVLVWAWRTHVPTAANPIPMALASATAATMMVVALPPVPPGAGWPGTPPDQPPLAGPLTAVPTGESYVVPIPAPSRGPTSTPPNQPDAIADAPPAPALTPVPVLVLPGVPPLVEQVPAPLDAVVPLSPQPLPALPEVPPLVPGTPPPLGRSGALTPQPLQVLPALQSGTEESITELDLVELP